MNETFSSSEKLKHKKHIDLLFSKGMAINHPPIRLIYVPIPSAENEKYKIGVSVPKRNFKKAVERNYLKRLLRETYRKNKYLLPNNINQSYALMFIYLGRKTTSYNALEGKMQKILVQFKEKVNL